MTTTIPELPAIYQLPYFVEVKTVTEHHAACDLLYPHNIDILVGKSLIDQNSVSLEYDDTKQCTMTELAEIFAGIPPFTLMAVGYIKANKETRTLVGYRVSNSENALGRSSVIDLQIKSDYPRRQVDHRTIQWIIYHKVAYVLKTK